MKIIKTLNIIGKILYNAIFIVLVIIAGTIAISTFKIPGNFKILTVQSGSMEPAIKKGGVVIVKPTENYKKDDVITVSEPSNSKISLTHRIFEVKEKDGHTFYITKGDANSTPDTEERPKENVLGKVLFSIPFIGYPINFAKTRDGLIFLIVIPTTLIIYTELISIKNEVKKLVEKRKKRKLNLIEKVELEIGEEEIKVEKGIKKLIKKIFPILLVSIFINIFSIGSTSSSFLDRETSLNNSFTAGCWGAPANPEKLSPENFITSNDVNFSWTSTANHCPGSQTFYRFQIFTDVMAQNLYDQSNWTSAAQFNISNLPDGDYWWRVQTKDENGFTNNNPILWPLNVSTTVPLNLIPGPLNFMSNQIDIPTPDIEISLSIHNFNINFQIENIPSDYGTNLTDSLNYEVLYSNSVGPQTIAGTITPSTVVNNSTSRQFYLGTCSSGGTCIPDSISSGSILSVTLNGNINCIDINPITKSFTF